MTKYIRIIKKQNTCNATLDLSIAVKVTLILFLCGLLNCIRADLFMNNALYKCCIITHCAVSHKDHIKKWYHRFIFHFFDLVEGVQQVGGVLRGAGFVGGRWCVRVVGGGGRHEIEQNWRFQ